MEQTQTNSQQTYNPTPPAPRPRSLERRDAKLAGVAGGLGAYFDIDPTIIRVLLIAATLVSGPVVPLFYVAAWIIMPHAGDIRPAPPAPAPPPATAQPTTTTPAPGSWAPAPATSPPASEATTPAINAAGDSTGDAMKVAAKQN
jgi:phage shock protein C